MKNHGRHSRADDHDIVELTRVQPIEAEVLVARLHAAGIAATLGADSVYPSLTVANGVPVLVAARDIDAAMGLLEHQDRLPGS